MNRRGKRLALTVAAAGLAVLLVLGIVHRDAVRDHVEAWHFQLTKETVMITPEAEWKEVGERIVGLDTISLVHAVANLQGYPAVFSFEQYVEPVMSGMRPLRQVVLRRENFREVLESEGYRVLEQRFPRRAYLVIRDPTRTRGTPP